MTGASSRTGLSSPDSVLDAIDGALCDHQVSADAMRWTPDPDAAETGMPSRSPLDGETGHLFQMAIWGYAIQGDVSEHSAVISETRAAPIGAADVWDRTAADLTGQMVAYGDGPYRRVRDHAALRWVTEHILRHDLEWPGL